MASSYEIDENYVCKICNDLLMDPVVLPCNHQSCLRCLEKTLDYNKYQCFLCRKPIQSWYRRTRLRKCLVNEKLRDEIEDQFPEMVEKRRNGESLDLPPPDHPKLVLSNPGEIRNDFESELAKWQQEIEKEKAKENELSEQLIKEIEQEENRRRLEEERKIKEDEEMARSLALQLNGSHTNEPKLEISLEDSDEALARELALASLPPKFYSKTWNLRNRTTHAVSKVENLNKRKRDEKSKRELPSKCVICLVQCSNIVHIDQDEILARKLAGDSISPLWKSKESPKVNKQKKKHSVSMYGPMDRFVETRKGTSN